MTERMPDERLAEIRASYPLNDDRRWETEDAIEAFEAVRELLAEVDRLRALEAPVRLLEAPAEPHTPEQIAQWQQAWDEMMQQPQELRIIHIPPPSAERQDAGSYHIRAEAIPNADGLEAAVLVDHAPCQTTIYGSGIDDADDLSGAELLTLMAAHHCAATARRAEPIVVDYATDRPAQPFAPDAPELTEEQKQAWAEAASAQIEELKQRGVMIHDLPLHPASDAPLWQPFRGKPRTIDYPFGG